MLQVILDVDAGVDDVYALLILLHAQDQKLLEIKAITCVRGNATTDHVYTNIQRILKLKKQQSIPVYVGENEPIVPVIDYSPSFYGVDGFGDVEDDSFDVKDSLKAVVAINEIVNNNPGKITLLCCGPLTNIALAMKTNRFLGRNLKEVFIMGGNYDEPVEEDESKAEYNFRCDAEAAFIIFNGLKCPVTVIPKETCEDIKYSYIWRFEYFKNIQNPVMDLMNRVEKKVSNNQEYWTVYDPFIIAMLLRPDIVKEYVFQSVTIDLKKHKGEMVVTLDHKKPIRIVTKLSQRVFTELLYSTLSSL